MRTTLFLLAFFTFGVGFAHASTPTQMCTEQYQPVCAAHPVQCIKAPCYPQYQTYGNACEASVANATVIHEGVCTETETGPVKEPEPYTPPKGCVAWFDGCNSCSLSPKGGAMCTLMACQIGSTRPGYCSKYESTSTPKPPVVAHPATTTSPGTSTSSVPTFPVEPAHPGFFHAFWNWVLHWFGK